jgi:hypothetical protein
MLDYLIALFYTLFSSNVEKVTDNNINFERLDLLSRDELIYVASEVYGLQGIKRLSKKQLIELIQNSEFIK